MSSLEGSKFGPVPLPLPTLKVYPFANNGVTQLMVENGGYPSTRRWLKELFCDDDPSASDVARRENALLRPAAPRDDVGIELGTIRIVLRP
jgi:hypothetical protein